jgi:hypothetical protein
MKHYLSRKSEPSALPKGIESQAYILNVVVAGGNPNILEEKVSLQNPNLHRNYTPRKTQNSSLQYLDTVQKSTTSLGKTVNQLKSGEKCFKS